MQPKQKLGFTKCICFKIICIIISQIIISDNKSAGHHQYRWFISFNYTNICDNNSAVLSGRYWRLFDGVFEAFHLLDRHLAVAVLIKLFDNELRSFSTVMKFVHQQLNRLWPRYCAVRLLPVHTVTMMWLQCGPTSPAGTLCTQYNLTI